MRTLGVLFACLLASVVSAAETPLSGAVVWTVDATGYTYVELETPSGAIWAAGPRTELELGDVVRLVQASPMADFYSPTLDRRFALIYFATALVSENASASADPPATPHPPIAESPTVEPGSVEALPGGMTIGEILVRARESAGTEVAVRARVVKVTRHVLGKTWLHLRDGTRTPDGADDLTVSTTDDAALGDLVVARGRIMLDRDLGHGYRFPVLLEDALVARE